MSASEKVAVAGSTVREDVLEVLRAVKLLPDGSVEVLGRPVPLAVPPPAPMPGLSPSQNAAEGRVLALQNLLYERAYCHRIGQDAAQPGPPADLSAALSQANPTRDRWEGGWQVTSLLPGGGVLAQRAGRTRKLWPGQFVTHDGPGIPPRPGTTLTVFSARESLTAQPGFYFAFSEEWNDSESNPGLWRAYWNVQPGGAPELLRQVGQRLNRFQIPFQFKALVNAAHYSRRDSAVLYVAQRYLHVLTELLGDLHERVAALLWPDVPLFTRLLFPGLGLAQDPGTGESFGMNRCARLAEGLWAAHDGGVMGDQGRLKHIEAAFAAHGLHFDRPERRARSGRAASQGGQS